MASSFPSMPPTPSAPVMVPTMGSSPLDDTPMVPSKRPRTTQACETCRKRKIKCNGTLPCKPCFDGQRECTYATRSGRSDSVDQDSMAFEAPEPLILDPTARTSTPSSVSNGLFVASSPPSLSEHSRSGVDEVTERMTLVTTVDENRRPYSYHNYGHSNGIHMLQGWSTSIAPILYYPSSFDQLPHRKELDRERQIFPPRAFVEAMIDVFFDSYHRFYPILSRAEVLEQLDRPAPNYALLYAVMAVGCLNFERQQRIGIGSGRHPRILASKLFLERAKRRIPRMLSSECHEIETLQMMLLCVNHTLQYPGASPWVLLGLCVRTAQDMALFLDLRAPQFAKVVAPNRLPIWAKVWAHTYAEDRIAAAVMGRPLTFNEAETNLNLEIFLRTPENEAKYDPALLVDGDHYFFWYIQLADIFGKIVRTVTAIHLRHKLPHTLPELHRLLSKYRTELPTALHFSPDVADPLTRAQTASLNILYYAAVVTLYRPTLTAKSGVLDVALHDQYLTLLETSLLAMIRIVHTIRDDLSLFPYDPFYEFSTMLSVCVLLVEHDHSQGRQTTQRMVSHLDLIDAMLDAASQPWPFSVWLQRVVREIRGKITKVAPDVGLLDAQMYNVMRQFDSAAEIVADLLEEPVDVQRDASREVAREYMARWARGDMGSPSFDAVGTAGAATAAAQSSPPAHDSMQVQTTPEATAPLTPAFAWPPVTALPTPPVGTTVPPPPATPLAAAAATAPSASAGALPIFPDFLTSDNLAGVLGPLDSAVAGSGLDAAIPSLASFSAHLPTLQALMVGTSMRMQMEQQQHQQQQQQMQMQGQQMQQGQPMSMPMQMPQPVASGGTGVPVWTPGMFDQHAAWLGGAYVAMPPGSQPQQRHPGQQGQGSGGGGSMSLY
ncbi:hypothetical protein AMAG_07671 [Allomyces macrogynus ATCC 38327]|uniref:Zn(2)-C6 fungal-type domain-containing protein n=1 Tax=Allomyces macrogynus (strain ATCC 38327) TaxID=578462 RepID=A0A0L0SJD1_ALLM3|nr:hypothetical protein AMAG_07671 [Allomyces macrogynus ATCC 38327]|eukprot:KNE62455.1 hypothetical protein AMAG_07671 [Allomyces macrogynus ATCC 38327]